MKFGYLGVSSDGVVGVAMMVDNLSVYIWLFNDRCRKVVWKCVFVLIVSRKPFLRSWIRIARE